MKTIDLRTLWVGELKSLFGALFVCIVATSTLFLVSAIFGLLIPVGEKSSAIIAFLFYDLVIALGCYYLCLSNPYSIWFVPVICNATGIVSAIIEPSFWVTSMWILTLLGWMVSLITSIWGHDIGLRQKRG
jgi:hypothetical protein